MSESRSGLAVACPDGVTTAHPSGEPVAALSSHLSAAVDGLLLELQWHRGVDAERDQLAALTVPLLVEAFERALAAGEDPSPTFWSAAQWLHVRGLVPTDAFAHLICGLQPEMAVA